MCGSKSVCGHFIAILSTVMLATSFAFAFPRFDATRISIPTNFYSEAGINDRGEIFIREGYVRTTSGVWIQVLVDSEEVQVRALSNTGLATGNHSTNPRGAYIWNMDTRQGSFLRDIHTLSQKGISDSGDILTFDAFPDRYVYLNGSLADFYDGAYSFDTSGLFPAYIDATGTVHGSTPSSVQSNHHPFSISNNTLSIDTSILIPEWEANEIRYAGAGGHVLIWAGYGSTKIYGGNLPSIVTATNFIGHHINANGISVGRSLSGNGSEHASIWAHGFGRGNLSKLATGLPEGVSLTRAHQINASLNIVASGSDGELYLLEPSSSPGSQEITDTNYIREDGVTTLIVSIDSTPDSVQLESSTDLLDWNPENNASVQTIGNCYSFILPADDRYYRVRATFN